MRLIDGLMVNGSARGVAGSPAWSAGFRPDCCTHYAFAMIVGLLLLVSLFVMVRL